MAKTRGRSPAYRLRPQRRRFASPEPKQVTPALLPRRAAGLPLSGAAVLLAAGESTRMGELKALLPWKGSTLLEYQVGQLLRTSLAEVVVVLGHRAQELRPLLPRREPRLRAIFNRRYRRGKSTSVVAGLKALRPGWSFVLILGVDQPRPAWVLERLLRAHRDEGARLTLPSHGGRRGHPPLFAAALGPDLLAITEESQGLREVVQRHKRDIQQVKLGTPLVLVNLNTREDYDRARRLLATAREG
ncbi:MAG: nucleotidyltransferase family protein [Chloroflexi bacterium]|nr:nucleotidyltransferase family protein [Chloroflexota bacterium]